MCVESPDTGMLNWWARTPRDFTRLEALLSLYEALTMKWTQRGEAQDREDSMATFFLILS